jgi:tetratricopeptide (TPR) repeat protein
MFINKIISALSFSAEVWMSLFFGAVVTVVIAYIIYRIQKKETIIHKQDHDAKLEEIKLLHQQDSEKIKVLYELIIQSQKGSIGEVEAEVLEQKIELAADNITEQDSDKAQALKAIAEKDKEEADDLLDKIAQREHDLVEVYELRAMNEFRNGYFAEAVKWYRKIVELEPDIFEAWESLIVTLIEADQRLEARELALKILAALDSQDPDLDMKTHTLLYSIVLSIDFEAETDLVEPYLLKNAELVKKLFGGQSQEMSCIYNELGRLASMQDKFKEAEEYYLKSIAIYKALKYTDDCIAFSNLAMVYIFTGRYGEALDLLEEAHAAMSEFLGAEHPKLIFVMMSKAHAYAKIGDFQAAELQLLKAKDLAEKKLGKEHKNYFFIIQNLAAQYCRQNRHEEAEPLIRETLEIQKAKKGEESIEVGLMRLALGDVLSAREEFREAEEHLSQAVVILNKFFPPESYNAGGAKTTLANFYIKIGKYEEARTGLLEVLQATQVSGRANTLEAANTQGFLAEIHEKLEQWSEAEPYLKSAILILEEIAPDNPILQDILMRYSSVLAKLGRQAEAVEYQAKAEELKAKLEGQTTEHTEKTENKKG